MKGPQIPLEPIWKMSIWRYAWMYWRARFRLSKTAVCVMSADQGLVDFHDYVDSKDKLPHHFTTMECERCGKEFSF